MLKLERADLLRQQAFVGGIWSDADTGEAFDVVNPATGAVVASVPDMGAAETRRAIESAEMARHPWAAQPAKARAVILRKLYALVMEHQEDLAHLMTAEQGKPLGESRGEIAYAASFIEWFAEEGKRTYGDIIPNHMPGKRILVIKQPVGVCAAITPWNFPTAMITRKIGPALAAGCSIVVKPAEATPLSALALCVLAQEAGLPEGVLSCITASQGAGVGGEMTSNPLVKKLSFTGSTATGALLMQQAAGQIKKVSLELGGNAPFIVFDDADIDAAVQGAIAAKFRNAGQTCVCTNRFYAQAGVYDEFVKKLSHATKQLSIGNGMDDGVLIGPMINAAAVDKTERHLRDAVTKGGSIETGGARAEENGPLFFAPTVVSGAQPEMLLAQEETFGPLAAVFKFDDEASVVAAANDTDAGLAAYLYTRDLGRAWRMGEALEYGMVGINEGIVSTEVAPFGGIKQSGIGREGSKYGIEDYLNIKYMLLGGLGLDGQ
ncbi:MAG: NAD-dependent succinate-semialdehyde dehydrogenase [Pseudomonadota bacterium]